jgi:hypothetical protein
MRKGIRSAALASLAVLLASTMLFAAPKAEQKHGSSGKGSTTQAITVKPANETGAYHKPRESVATTLTSAECEGLGGTVQADSACPITNKICVRKDKNGGTYSECLTLKLD